MKILLGFLFICLALLFSNKSNAQSFQIRIVENATNYLEVQIRETSGTGTPSTTTIISKIEFQVRWQSSLITDIDFVCSAINYNIIDANGSLQAYETFNYRSFESVSTSFNCPSNWVTGHWETIIVLKVTSGSGVGDFEVAPDN
jgi:hypothetical protein